MRLSKNAGFSLLEVMVAVAILVVIMTLVWSSTSQSLNTKDMVEERDLIFQNARVAMRKMSDDIAVAFLVKRAQPLPSSAPEEGETAPAAAQALQMKTFFIGGDEGGRDSLKLTSLSHLRLFKGAKESDQSRIMYEVVPDAEEPGVFNLVRREEAWLGATLEVEGRALVLARDVRALNLEYYDERKGEWVKEWDTEVLESGGLLPKAAKIVISFPDPNDEEKELSFSTAVILALSDAPIEM